MSIRFADEQLFQAVCRDPAYWPSVRPGSWACTYETFATHPRHPGWRYAYIDGRAEVWPNFYANRTRLRIESRESIPTPWTVESAHHASHTGLVRLFRRSFGGSPDLLGTPSREEKRLAQDNIAAWRAGGLTRESAIVSQKRGSAALAGAILLQWQHRSSNPTNPSWHLNGSGRMPEVGIIMVEPAMQGYGIGRALLQYASEKMRERGCNVIESAYRLVSDRARRWYHRQGFSEVPGRLSARLMARRAERLMACAPDAATRDRRRREFETLDVLSRVK